MPDHEALRLLSRRASALAGQTRDAASEVLTARSVAWVSTGASSFKADLEQDARDIRAAADELDDLARNLTRYADDVEHRVRQIEDAMSVFGDLVGDARRTLSNAVAGVDDAVTDGARRIVDLARRAPSPGSLDWPGFLGGRR